MFLVESALKDVPHETKKAFLAYHKQNPEIWKAIEETTLKIMRQIFKERYGQSELHK